MEYDQTPFVDVIRDMPAPRRLRIGVVASVIVAHILVTVAAAAITSSPGMLTMWLDAAATVAIALVVIAIGVWLKHLWQVTLLVAALLSAYVVSLLLRMPPQEGWTWIVRAAKPVIEVVAASCAFSAFQRWTKPAA